MAEPVHHCNIPQAFSPARDSALATRVFERVAVSIAPGELRASTRKRLRATLLLHARQAGKPPKQAQPV